jgi:predicted esterase
MESFFIAKYNQDQILESVNTVIDLIKDEGEVLDGQYDHIFIGGFDKGCCVALATYLQFQDGKLGGVAGVSGLFCAEVAWPALDLDHLMKTPVMLYHGHND